MLKPYMAPRSSVRDGDAAFTSSQCRRNRGHLSSESTCESRRAADSTSRFPSARRCPTSRRSPGGIQCTESIPLESDVCWSKGIFLVIVLPLITVDVLASSWLQNRIRLSEIERHRHGRSL